MPLLRLPPSQHGITPVLPKAFDRLSSTYRRSLLTHRTSSSPFLQKRPERYCEKKCCNHWFSRIFPTFYLRLSPLSSIHQLAPYLHYSTCLDDVPNNRIQQFSFFIGFNSHFSRFRIHQNRLDGTGIQCDSPSFYMFLNTSPFTLSKPKLSHQIFRQSSLGWCHSSHKALYPLVQSSPCRYHCSALQK